jgi:ABC-type sugar transport system permease subunit
MMVFVAALQGLPREVHEAAVLDGANAVQRTLHVTLPALRNTIVFVVTVTAILAFRLFVQPYLMTRGGPDGATRSVIQLIYELTFVSNDLGRACAGAFLFLLAVGLLTGLQRALWTEDRG